MDSLFLRWVDLFCFELANRIGMINKLGGRANCSERHLTMLRDKGRFLFNTLDAVPLSPKAEFKSATVRLNSSILTSMALIGSG